MNAKNGTKWRFPSERKQRMRIEVDFVTQHVRCPYCLRWAGSVRHWRRDHLRECPKYLSPA
jgi:hypothetical protein